MEQVLAIVSEILEIEPNDLDIHQNKAQISAWDSLAHIQIIAELDEQLGIKIPFEELSNIQCIADFEKYIK